MLTDCVASWAVEFLKKEGFIEGDTDEILEEVDRQVMERDVRRIKDACLGTGLAGIAAYARSRLDSDRMVTDYQPFDTEYLEELDRTCRKNGVEWMSEDYHISALWQTLLPLLPATDTLSWQKGLLIINKNHG